MSSAVPTTADVVRFAVEGRMAKDGKKTKTGKKARKAEQAAMAAGETGAPKRAKGAKGKKRARTRADVVRSTLARPVTIAAAAGAAVVAGLTGLWRARR
jgi:hypothetical protein